MSKISETFYPLTIAELEVLRDCQLINNTTLVYLWLKLQNPYSATDSKPVEYDVIKIAEELQVSESSVYRAIGKLKKEGLIKVTKSRVALKWQHDFVKREENPVKKNTCKKSTNTSVSQNTEDCVSVKDQPQTKSLSNTIEKQKDSNSSLPKNTTPKPITSIADEQENSVESLRKENKSNNKPQINYSEAELQQIAELAKQKRLQQEQESGGDKSNLQTLSSIMGCNNHYYQSPNDPQANMWMWLPDGPWKTESGKLDPEFQEWLAKEFIKSFGTENIHKAKADVLAYFQNQETRLPIRWQEYHDTFVAKAENIQLRQQHGLTISDKQQQETIAMLNAVKPVPEYMSVAESNPTKAIPTTNLALPQQESKTVEAEIVCDSQDVVCEDEYGWTVKTKIFKAEEVEAELPAVNPIAAKMTQYFSRIMMGQTMTDSLEDQIEVVNYALSKVPEVALWQRFARQLENNGCEAIVNNEGLITKLQVPSLVGA